MCVCVLESDCNCVCVLVLKSGWRRVLRVPCCSVSGEGEPLSGDYCVGSAAVRRSLQTLDPKPYQGSLCASVCSVLFLLSAVLALLEF